MFTSDISIPQVSFSVNMEAAVAIVGVTFFTIKDICAFKSYLSYYSYMSIHKNLSLATLFFR